MREIKFRAWDKDKKQMIYKFNMTSDGQPYAWDKATIGDGIVIDEPAPLNVELMQYTGLEDKNGREIYEGDIVRVGKDRIGIVRFGRHRVTADDNFHSGDSYGWHIEYKLESGKEKEGLMNLFVWDGYHTTSDNIEVIGNIYENPELLEETENEKED